MVLSQLLKKLEQDLEHQHFHLKGNKLLRIEDRFIVHFIMPCRSGGNLYVENGFLPLLAPTSGYHLTFSERITSRQNDTGNLWKIDYASKQIIKSELLYKTIYEQVNVDPITVRVFYETFSKKINLLDFRAWEDLIITAAFLKQKNLPELIQRHYDLCNSPDTVRYNWVVASEELIRRLEVSMERQELDQLITTWYEFAIKKLKINSLM